MDERTAEAEALRASLAKVEQDLKDRVALTEGLQREKAMLSEEVASLRAELSAARKAAASEANGGRLQDEAMQQKLARLEAIEASYNRILASYREYAAKEDSLVSAKGDAGLVEAKQHLNAFLISNGGELPGVLEPHQALRRGLREGRSHRGPGGRERRALRALAAAARRRSASSTWTPRPSAARAMP